MSLDISPELHILKAVSLCGAAVWRNQEGELITTCEVNPRLHPHLIIWELHRKGLLEKYAMTRKAWVLKQYPTVPATYTCYRITPKGCQVLKEAGL